MLRMAKSDRSSLMPRWFRHRWLVEAEAVLLVGVGQQVLQGYVAHLGWPRWGQVLWTMGCTLGILGGVLLFVRVIAKTSVAKAHQTVQKMPLPLPLLFLHVLAFAGLFCLYAWVWDLWPFWV